MPWDLGVDHRPNHNSYALYYHVVFVTHRREPLIDREIARFLGGALRKICVELEVHLLEQGILCDHVHLVLSLRPTHYIPEVINYLKGTSAHEANQHHDFQNVLRWMRGYHVSTISPANLARARQYVRSQCGHHPDRVPA